MKKYITFIATIFLLSGGVYFSQTWFSESFTPAETSVATTTKNTPSELSDSPPPPPARTNEIQNTVVDTTAPSPLHQYTIPVSSEGTVLEVMNAYAAQSDFSFSGREFAGLGLLIEEIGGLKNAGGFYWTLYINNKLSEKGVSSVRVAPPNIVEWRYQKGV